MKEFFQVFFGSILSSAVIIAAAVFVFKESFKRLLDQRIETYRHQLGIDAKTRELALKSQLEFRERQLAEFYGPIYALLKQGKPIYKFWELNRLEDISDEVRDFFRHANETIVSIIQTKSHLIVGEKFPESFLHFMTHVTVWHAFIDLRRDMVYPFEKEEFPEAFFPEQFNTDIFETTERLKKELFELHAKYGFTAAR
jgi:hypothetical protein